MQKVNLNILYLYLLVTVSVTFTEPLRDLTYELFVESLMVTSQMYTPASDTTTYGKNSEFTVKYSDDIGDMSALLHL